MRLRPVAGLLLCWLIHCKGLLEHSSHHWKRCAFTAGTRLVKSFQWKDLQEAKTEVLHALIAELLSSLGHSMLQFSVSDWGSSVATDNRLTSTPKYRYCRGSAQLWGQSSPIHSLCSCKGRKIGLNLWILSHRFYNLFFGNIEVEDQHTNHYYG